MHDHRARLGPGIGSRSAVSGDERHEAELFAETELYSSSTEVAYPGGAAAARSRRGHLPVLLRLRVDRRIGRLEVLALVPTEATFQHDSSTVPDYPTFSGRSVYCVLRAGDGRQLEGSLIAEKPG